MQTHSNQAFYRSCRAQHGTVRFLTVDSATCCSSSSKWQQPEGGWLRQAAAVVRASPSSRQAQTSLLQHEQWVPYDYAADQQQHLHEVVYRHQQQQQPQAAAPQQASDSQAHQQHNFTGQQPWQQLHGSQAEPQRVRRNRSWQVVAAQLELGSKVVSLPRIVDCLQQLVLPGGAPIDTGKPQPHFITFLLRLLTQLHHHLQAAVQQQQQPGDCVVVANQMSKVLWVLAKLQLQPDWEAQQQQQQAVFRAAGSYQHPRLQQQQQQMQLERKAADVVTSAVTLLQLQLQLVLQQPRDLHSAFSPKVLSRIVWGLSRLQCPVSSGFLQLYLSVSLDALQSCNCRDLACIATALSQLGCRPGPEWTTAFYNAASAAIEASSAAGDEYDTVQVAALLLSAAELPVSPPDGWVQHMLATITGLNKAQQQQQQQGQLRQGAAQQEVQQQQAQLLQGAEQQLLHSSQAVCLDQTSMLARMGPRALASLLGATAKWCQLPDGPTFLQLQLAALRVLGSCNGIDTAQILWAMATLAAASPAVQLASERSAAVRSAQQGASRSMAAGRGAHVSHAAHRARPGGSNSTDMQDPAVLTQGSVVAQQQQQQPVGVLVLLPQLLQGLTVQLGNILPSTPPHQVVLGMWAVAKLHALTRPQQPLQQEQQQDKQHWQCCRQALHHCASHFQSAGVMSELNCHSLVLLSWSLALAGAAPSSHFIYTQQQQQQQQQATAPAPAPAPAPGMFRRTAGSNSSSSSNYVGFHLPSEFLLQLLACTRLSLREAAPHSQALLLSALVRMQIKPPWQWLLGFWEASEPCLQRCSPQDLSMMAEASVRLQVKPLDSWRTAFLDVSRGLMQQVVARQGPEAGAVTAAQAFPPSCLTAVVNAVADPLWGLVPPDVLYDDSSSSSSTPTDIPTQWVLAVQQHVLLLLPELQLSEVAPLLKSAAALGWYATDSANSSSTGSGSDLELSRRAVVSGLLQAAVDCGNALEQQQQRQGWAAQQQWQQPGKSMHMPHVAGTEAEASSGAAVGVMQCLAAALELPQAAVPSKWWLVMLQQLQQLLQHPGSLASLTLRQLHAGSHTLLLLHQAQSSSRRHTKASQEGSWLPLLQTLQLLLTASARRAPDMGMQQLAFFMLLGQRTAVLYSSDAQAVWSYSNVLSSRSSSSSSSSSSSCTPAARELIRPAAHDLQLAILSTMMQRMCSANLAEFAAAVYTMSQCGFLARGAAPIVAGDAESATTSSSSNSLTSATIISSILDVLQQHLLQLEQVMLQEQQVLQSLQQQQQQQHESWTSPSSSRLSVAAQDAATHLLRLLVAFAHIHYRPPAHLLQQMLRVLEVGMSALTPHQLSLLAAAAAALQLGAAAPPSFSRQLWQVLSTALQPPEPLQQQIKEYYVKQLEVRKAADVRKLKAAAAAAAAEASVTAAGEAAKVKTGGHAAPASAAAQAPWDRAARGGRTAALGSDRRFAEPSAAAAAAAATALPTLAHAAPPCSELVAAVPTLLDTAPPAVSAPYSSRHVQLSGPETSGHAVFNTAVHRNCSVGDVSRMVSSSASSRAARSCSRGWDVNSVSASSGSRHAAAVTEVPRPFLGCSSSSSRQYSSSSSSRQYSRSRGGALGLGVVPTSVRRNLGISSSSSSSLGLQYSVCVLMAVKALHTLCCERVGACDSSRLSAGKLYAAACSTSCRAAIGTTPPRQVASAAFTAVATIAQYALQPATDQATTALIPHQRHKQQQQQQLASVIVALLRLLHTAACWVSGPDLSSFLFRVGPLLHVLEGRQKRRAWKALYALLQAYRAGRRFRQELLQTRQDGQQDAAVCDQPVPAVTASDLHAGASVHAVRHKPASLATQPSVVTAVPDALSVIADQPAGPRRQPHELHELLPSRPGPQELAQQHPVPKQQHKAWALAAEAAPPGLLRPSIRQGQEGDSPVLGEKPQAVVTH